MKHKVDTPEQFEAFMKTTPGKSATAAKAEAHQALARGHKAIAISTSGYGVMLSAAYDRTTEAVSIEVQIGTEKRRLSVEEARIVAARLAELADAALDLGNRQ